MSDERKRLDELIRLMISESIDKMVFLTEDDDEPTSGEQLSWLQGQGAQEIQDREDEEAKAYYDDGEEMHVPWDEQVHQIAHLLNVVALQVIDYYNGKPGFTAKNAKQEILDVIGVPLDVFLGKQSPFGPFESLDQIISEEFPEMSENYNELGSPGVTDIDLNINGGNSSDMGDISE
jgi:hypothetical protein